MFKIRYKNILEKLVIHIAIVLVAAYLVIGSVIAFADDSEQHQIIQSYKTFRQIPEYVCETGGKLKLYGRWPIAVIESRLIISSRLQEILFVSIGKQGRSPQEWYFVKDKEGALVEWGHDDFDFWLRVTSTDFYQFSHQQANGCKKLTYIKYEDVAERQTRQA